jgi:hypothetical protein
MPLGPSNLMIHTVNQLRPVTSVDAGGSPVQAYGLTGTIATATYTAATHTTVLTQAAGGSAWPSWLAGRTITLTGIGAFTVNTVTSATQITVAGDASTTGNLVATGLVVPDVTVGAWANSGTLGGGKQIYRNATNGWWLEYESGGGVWYATPAQHDLTGAYWSRTSATPVGDYIAGGTATNPLTMAAGNPATPAWTIEPYATVACRLQPMGSEEKIRAGRPLAVNAFNIYFAGYIDVDHEDRFTGGYLGARYLRVAGPPNDIDESGRLLKVVAEEFTVSEG